MEKPEFKVSEPYLDYMEVKKYLQDKYPSLNMREVWLYFCERGFIENGSFLWFNTEEDHKDDYVQEFSKALYEEYARTSFNFYINW